MKQYIIKAGIMALSVLPVACTGNYLEINTNPYEVGKDQMGQDGYDVSSAMTAVCASVVSTDVNTAQFTDCLLGGPMGGYYSTTGAFAKTIDNFNPSDDWTRVFMESQKIIPTLYTNLNLLKSLTDDPVILAMANVVKVAAMHRVTDTYGPIPYSQIGVGGKLGVPYDSQEKVYDQMFIELDECIGVLTENMNSIVSSNADPVYGGNVEKWCRFANSLKLRLAMRIVYADKDKAQARISEVLAHQIGAFVSNDDNAYLQPIAFGEKGNPIYTAVKYNQVQGSRTGGDTHAAADITSYMNAYNDPRRPEYFIPSEFADKAYEYVGVLVSAVKPPLSKTGRKYSGVNISSSDPIMWMNASEVAFLKAEAAVLGLIAGSAEEFYTEGIRLSFEQWGVAGYENYINNDEKAPVNYVDPAGGENRPDVLTDLAVKWDDSASVEVKQERVLIQKWIANYHLGNEAWADHRRTGYPKFFPASAEGNKSGNIVDNELGARRMPYPQSESSKNYDNYRQACDELLKGRDNMATRVWWDCKPINK